MNPENEKALRDHLAKLETERAKQPSFPDPSRDKACKRCGTNLRTLFDGYCGPCSDDMMRADFSR